MDAIWAVFHEPGSHRYAVHFLDPGTRDLENRVVVGKDFHGGLKLARAALKGQGMGDGLFLDRTLRRPLSTPVLSDLSAL